MLGNVRVGIGTIVLSVMILAITSCETYPLPKGWSNGVAADLEEAAKAEESYFTDNGTYTASLDDLKKAGLDGSPSPYTTITVARADTDGYCLNATYSFESHERQWHLHSEDNFKSGEGTC